MILQQYTLLFVGLLVMVPATHAVYAYSDTDTSSVTVSEILSYSLPVIKEQIRDGNIDDARTLSAINAEIFPLHLQNLRAYDGAVTDEIHILLLDIHDGIGDVPDSEILVQIENIERLLMTYPIMDPDYGMVIAMLLSVSDEQYQKSQVHNNPLLYDYALYLAERSHELFSHTVYDDRLRLEIDSFLGDLTRQIKDKQDFVLVGTLVTTINRDLTGAEPVSYDKQGLYDAIYGLYDEMLVALDTANYDTAEALAIEAYLENFEYLEADIEQADPELLYSLELDMREELRTMIKDGQDSEQIRAFLQESILPDLQTAESMVTTQGGTVSGDIIPQKVIREMGDASSEQKSGVRSEIDFIRNTLQEMLIQYDTGDYQAAYNSARTAYLDSYESVEIPLRAINPDFTLEVEFQFASLRNLIKEQAEYDKVRDQSIAIKRNLDESERLVTGTGVLAPAIAFSSSFAVIFREGLESVLVLGAILTYLEASRNNRFKKHVYLGVLFAVAATAVTWFVASFIIDISGANRELIEAIAALSATAMLFYVSFWVLNKIEHKKWMEFVKAKVWQATTTGSVTVFVLLSFFTVYREGFETVLFYQAMSGFAKYMEGYVGLGFAAGLGVLFLIYYIMRKIGRRLPLRVLFGLTMGVGAYMSITFLGNAVRELQILDLVPYTGLFGIIPRLDINLATMTGIYPTLETILSQLVLLGIYLVASLYVLVLRPRLEKRLTAMRRSHGDANAC